jgi:hypothetical protein
MKLLETNASVLNIFCPGPLLFTDIEIKQFRSYLEKRFKSRQPTFHVLDPEFGRYANSKINFRSCVFFPGVKATHLEELILISPNQDTWIQVSSTIYKKLKRILIYGIDSQGPEFSFSVPNVYIMDEVKFMNLSHLESQHITTRGNTILPQELKSLDVSNVCNIDQIPQSISSLHIADSFVSEIKERMKNGEFQQLRRLNGNIRKLDLIIVRRNVTRARTLVEYDGLWKKIYDRLDIQLIRMRDQIMENIE